MTMAKLADLAGVSVSTVSKAFSGSDEISEEKRQHIFRIAKENGCYDKYCKSVYTGIVIAVICTEYKSSRYAQMLSLIEEKIKKHNGIMIVSSTDFSDEKAKSLLEFFSEYSKVDGIICLNNLPEGFKCSVPVVVLAKNDSYNSIIAYEEKAVDEAIKTLKEYGHRDIAFIGERLTSSRREVFVDTIKKHGLKLNSDFVIESEKRYEEAGYTEMNSLFEKGTLPTAVVAGYDNIAIGVMKSIYEHGFRIPDDFSVVGYDDINELPYLDVPLASISPCVDELCEIIVEFMFERIKKCYSKELKTIKVNKQFVKRESVGKAPERKNK